MNDIVVIMTDEAFCKTCLDVVNSFFKKVFEKGREEFKKDKSTPLIPF